MGYLTEDQREAQAEAQAEEAEIVVDNLRKVGLVPCNWELRLLRPDLLGELNVPECPRDEREWLQSLQAEMDREDTIFLGTAPAQELLERMSEPDEGPNYRDFPGEERAFDGEALEELAREDRAGMSYEQQRNESRLVDLLWPHRMPQDIGDEKVVYSYDRLFMGGGDYYYNV